MNEDCQCGHAASLHSEKAPHACQAYSDCGCQAYTIPPKPEQPDPPTNTETDGQSPMADTGPRLDVVCARCNHHADHHRTPNAVLQGREIVAFEYGAFRWEYGACGWKECDCSCLVWPATDQVLADRPPPSRPSRTIMPLNIDRETERLLEHLVASGLWGRSVEEAAERVLCHGLSDLLATPVLEHTRTELHGRQRRHVGSA